MKSVKCTKAHFVTGCRLFEIKIFYKIWVTVFFFVLTLVFFSVWLQLTEEVEKAQSLIDDMSSQLNEVKLRLVSDYHTFSNNSGNYCVWSQLLLLSFGYMC